MNFFSTDAFLETAGDVFHPGQRHIPETFLVQGQHLRMLSVGQRRRPMLRCPFMDFVQPLAEGPQGQVREWPWVPRTVIQTTPVEDRAPESKAQHPSPFIRWDSFADWTAFEAFVSQRQGKLWSDSRRQRQRLEREAGALTFVFDDPRQEVVERCIEWKSAQYTASGLIDMFAREQNVRLFHELRARKALTVSALRVGERIAAVSFGAVADGRYHYWVPAYDAALAKYSPGRLLMEDLMRESFVRGHQEFDFLIGNEAYKFHYATHSRLIGPLGEEPIAVGLRKRVTRSARKFLRAYPPLFEMAQRVRRRFRA